MPLRGVRYRVRTYKSGRKVRLAFRGRTVVESKNLKTGATHTPAEFRADRRKRRRKKIKARRRRARRRKSPARKRRGRRS